MICKAAIALLTIAALGTAVLWVSLPPCSGIDLSTGAPPRWKMTWCGGGLHIERNEWLPNVPNESPRSFGTYYSSQLAGGSRITKAYLPLWIPLVLFSMYPTIAFVRGPYRRHRRRKKGHCLKCGYDLTGNISGVCPECGERKGFGT